MTLYRQAFVVVGDPNLRHKAAAIELGSTPASIVSVLMLARPMRSTCFDLAMTTRAPDRPITAATDALPVASTATTVVRRQLFRRPRQRVAPVSLGFRPKLVPASKLAVLAAIPFRHGLLSLRELCLSNQTRGNGLSTGVVKVR
jgi:hypothetical protein